MEPPGMSFLKHYRCFNPTIKVYQSSVLIITFIAYACFHASRKPISIAKGVLKSGWKPFDGSTATARLGDIDVSFLLVYSIGMFFAGHVGDRVDLRIFLTVGMIGSGTFVAMFGMGYWFNIHSFFYYLCMQVVQGLFQATGWPSVVAIVDNWFGKGKGGLIMGIWNAHTSIGNICGSLIAVAVLQYGWEWYFLLPGILVAVAGIIVYLFLVVNPEDVVDEVRSERINLEDQSLLKCGQAGLLKETLPPTESHRGPVKVFIELSKTGTSCDSMKGAIDPSKAEIHGDSGDGKHDIEESTVEGEEEGLLRSCTTAQIHSTATNAVGFVEAWMIPGVHPMHYVFSSRSWWLIHFYIGYLSTLSIQLLLVMASFASTSASGYCKSWSSTFKGPCLDDPLCSTTCIVDDHASYGACEWSSKGFACFCYNPC